MLTRWCVNFFFCKQKTAYEMRISDWSSDVCSSDLVEQRFQVDAGRHRVDRSGMVAVGDLDQAQFGPEGVFAHEFGIDRDEIAVLDEVAEFGERGAGLDKRMNLHAAPIQRVGAEDRKSTRLNSSH